MRNNKNRSTTYGSFASTIASPNQANRASQDQPQVGNGNPNQHLVCFQGESLIHLLEAIQREIVSARASDSNLPYKIWLKQQFSIGVNDVTRVLERMRPISISRSHAPFLTDNCKAHPVRLQAILLASDCNPRWLTKHLPNLASSREVPIIFVRDDKEGSLKLGELVKLKTTIAIGIKAKGSSINGFIENVLSHPKSHVDTED